MTTWTATDDQFFRTVAHVFPAEFVFGAGVLLASYDDDEVPAAPAVPVARVPVRVRIAAPV